jgi:hypothetical protein
MNNLDFRKIVLKGNLTEDDGCAHQEYTQELFYETRTSGFKGRVGTQEALSGE